MAALDNYLGMISPLSGFAYGSTEALDRFKQTRGTQYAAAAALGYALSSMRAAWQAFPNGVRNEAVSALTEAADNALSQIGDLEFDSVPILKAVFDLVVGLVEAGRSVRAINTASSLQMLNVAQERTFYRAKTPTDWIYTQLDGDLYMHYGGGTGKDRWRSRPALTPVGRAMTAFGFGLPSSPSGNCDPGKPYKSRGGEWKAKNDSSRCRYQTAFSALFYPWWDAGLPADPLPYYGKEVWPDKALAGKFKDPGVDPNEVLIERQTKLLSDPKINLQADGSYLRNLHDNLVKWVSASEEGDPQPGTLLARRGPIDEAFVPSRDYESDPKVRLYRDANGLIKPYSEVADDYGPDAFLAHNYGTAITIGMYNAVVSMTRAFFTARALFLQNRVAMQTYVREDLVNTFDQEVRAAVRDAAAPKPPGFRVPLRLGIPTRPPSVHPPPRTISVLVDRWEPPMPEPAPEPGLPAASVWMFRGSIALAVAAVTAHVVGRFRGR